MPPSPAGAGTGTATILFTDLVGSTTLRTTLGEERAEAHRQAHDRLLADMIAKHRGTLHDDRGDGVMASFTGAVDAVAAAVAIQQAITADGRRAEATAVMVRIGISAGDVAWEDARRTCSSSARRDPTSSRRGRRAQIGRRSSSRG